MKEKLYHTHVTILIFMVQVGVGLFTLPRTLADTFGYNGWLAVLIVSAAVFVNIALIGIVYKLGQGKSVFDIMESSFPKFVTYPVYIGLIGVWALLGCMVAKLYTLIFQTMAYPTTHPMLLKLVMDILIFLLVIQGIYNLSKAATLFFWCVIFLVMLLFFFTDEFQVSNLTPFIMQDSRSLGVGFLKAYSAFLGYEIALFLMPYMDKDKKLGRAMVLSNLWITGCYLAVCITAFGIYSLEQLRRINYPLLDLLGLIQFPFIERVENMLFGLFLFSIIVTVAGYTWMALDTLERMVPRMSRKWLAALMISFMYIVAYIPDTLIKVNYWGELLSVIETAIAFGLPILLITLLLIQRRRGRTHA
ncbi:GerAB/ArcD/ProY family transporter [Paenibacillus sp. GCM10023252]|uniref:GerAB/ArcD/ProY family transporter n=1 Tax=Paenibacillus sp. GCM10023252 TaxID=3252649 RepID=UPI0036136731